MLPLIRLVNKSTIGKSNRLRLTIKDNFLLNLFEEKSDYNH